MNATTKTTTKPAETTPLANRLRESIQWILISQHVRETESAEDADRDLEGAVLQLAMLARDLDALERALARRAKTSNEEH